MAQFDNIRSLEGKGKVSITSDSINWTDGESKIETLLSDIDEAEFLPRRSGVALRLFLKDGEDVRYNGFQIGSFEQIRGILSTGGVELRRKEIDTRGRNWGQLRTRGKASVEFYVEDKLAFELSLAEISQANVQPRGNELLLEFQTDDTKVGEDELCEMRFFVPNSGAEAVYGAADSNEDTSTAQFLHKQIVAGAEVDAVHQAMVTLEEIPFATPRGRYQVELHSNFIKLHGKSYDYKLLYKHISHLFLLPAPDGRNLSFVLSLDPRHLLRRGQTTYNHLVMVFSADTELSIEPNLTPEMETKYAPAGITRSMTGKTYRVVRKLFEGFTGKIALRPDSFRGKDGAPCVRCSYKADEGHLYPMEKSFFYIHKPPIMIRMDEIAGVEFSRVQGQGSTRTFEFNMSLKTGGSHSFRNIPREDYQLLFDFVQSKNLKIDNLKQLDQPQAAPRYRQEAVSSDSEDEQALRRAKAAQHMSGTTLGTANLDEDDSEDDDFEGDAKSDDEDSLEEDSDAAPASDVEEDAKEHKKKRARSPLSGEASTAEDEPEDDVHDPIIRMDEDDEEEKPTKKGKSSKSSGREKRKGEDNDDGKKKKRKKKKDPHAPKGAQTAFIIFSTEYRAKLKADGVAVSFGEYGKLAGEKWKEMTDADKEPYNERAAVDKKRYEREMEAYKAKNANATTVDSD